MERSLRRKILHRLHSAVHRRRRLDHCRITCIGLGDGVGSQMHGRLSTLLYARHYNITYIHTPLENLEHLPEGANPEKITRDWEEFFNLGDGEVQRKEIPDTPRFLRKPHRVWLRPDRFYAVTHCHRAMMWHPQAYASWLPEFRRRYHKTPKPELTFYPPYKHHIAVHLRRGDVSHAGKESFRYTSENQLLGPILKHAENIQNSTGRDCLIHVFSQGQPDEFSQLRGAGAQLHLDEDPMVSFHHLVAADSLFMAKSTFSYLAGMLSSGHCYYEPSWLPCMPGWRNFTNDPQLHP